MGTLANPRHERFVQALFEGETADAAYAKAGYKPNDGNCIRLKGNERVQTRLAELQAQAAKKSEVTVQSLLAELETARERADSAEQFSASVRAIEAKAKISGVMVEKIEVTTVNEAFDNAHSFEEIADVLASAMAKDKGCKLTEEERAGFAKLLEEWVRVIDEYLAGCTAKPVHPSVSVKDQEYLERRRLGLPRPVGRNGASR
jgi:phage terminase small subunit